MARGAEELLYCTSNTEEPYVGNLRKGLCERAVRN